MIAAMRTILEDILPKMNYDREKKEKKIVSEEDNLRNFSNLNIDSKNIQDNHNLSFEFYPHISPKLSDNWDFQSQLLGVTFPSEDSENISKKIGPLRDRRRLLHGRRRFVFLRASPSRLLIW